MLQGTTFPKIKIQVLILNIPATWINSDHVLDKDATSYSEIQI